MNADLVAAYEERVALLEDARRTLEGQTGQQLASVPHIDRIAFRVKKAESFANKVAEATATEKPYEQPLLEVEDQIAGRVIVFFRDDIEQVTEQLFRLFTPVEALPRQPAKDAEFGYESFHVVAAIPDWAKPAEWAERDDLPTMFELQVRTLFQHAYAEPQHDLSYKPSDPLTGAEKRELAWVAASAWGADAALIRVREGLDERTK